MGSRAPHFSIVLAAGEGTRMRSATRHKVCFPINGRPAINRALKTYNECGIKQQILVVGALAGQVVETVGAEFENAIFVYQADRLGTAHAAQQAMKVIDGLQSEQDVLLVAGDRIIKSTVLEQLFDLYYSQNCDMVVLAVPSRPKSSQGRLVTDGKGQLVGIVEAADVRQRQVFKELHDLAGRGSPPDCDAILHIVKTGFSTEGKRPDDIKCEKAFGDLWRALTGHTICQGSRLAPAKKIQQRKTKGNGSRGQRQHSHGGRIKLLIHPGRWCSRSRCDYQRLGRVAGAIN